MKAQIFYALSEKGQKEAAKKGLNAKKLQIIETEVTKKDQIDLLSIKQNGNGELKLCEGNPEKGYAYNSVATFDDVQTPDSLFEFQKKLNEKNEREKKEREKRRNIAEKKAIEKLNNLESYKDAYQHFLKLKDEKQYVSFIIVIDGFRFQFADNNDPNSYSDDVIRIDLSRFQNEYYQEQEKIRIEKEEKKRKDAELLRLKEEGKEKLKSWAQANGTVLLKARIEENLNWFTLANTEFFQSVLPDGFGEVPDGFVDDEGVWDNASLEAIQKVREIREQMKSKDYFVDVKPYFRKYEVEDYDYDEDRYDNIYSVDITLRSPALVEKTFSFICS